MKRDRVIQAYFPFLDENQDACGGELLAQRLKAKNGIGRHRPALL